MMSRPVLGALLLTLLACGAVLLWDADSEADEARSLLVVRGGPATTPLTARNRSTALAPSAAAADASASSRPAVDTTARPAPFIPGHAAWAELSASAQAAWSAPAPPPPPPPPPAARPAVTLAAGHSPVPAPPPPSQAPPFAFELIGTVAEGDTLGALLQGPQQSLWVRAGDTVDGAWRVQRVEARSVELLWMPQQLPARIGFRAPS